MTLRKSLNRRPSTPYPQRNVCLMMPWIVMTGICLFLNIFNVLFSIASSPTPVNIISSTGGWGLGLYFFLVVCAFKAELEREGSLGVRPFLIILTLLHLPIHPLLDSS